MGKQQGVFLSPFLPIACRQDENCGVDIRSEMTYRRILLFGGNAVFPGKTVGYYIWSITLHRSISHIIAFARPQLCGCSILLPQTMDSGDAPPLMDVDTHLDHDGLISSQGSCTSFDAECSTRIDGIVDEDVHVEGYEHIAQFYGTEAYLLKVLTNFTAPALQCRDAVVVIATKNHLDALEDQLGDRGIPVVNKKDNGQLILFDAHEMLKKIMDYDN